MPQFSNWDSLPILHSSSTCHGPLIDTTSHEKVTSRKTTLFRWKNEPNIPSGRTQNYQFQTGWILGILKSQTHPHFSMHRPINGLSRKQKHNCQGTNTSSVNRTWPQTQLYHKCQSTSIRCSFCITSREECVLATSQEITSRSWSPLSELQALVTEADGVLPSCLLRWCRHT